MTRKRISKVLLVWLCIITLLMPFCSEVLAVALTKESTKATLESIAARSGGYAYRINNHDVLKVVQKDDSSFSDVFYCVNAEKSLSVTHPYNYRRVAEDFTDFSDPEVSKWASSLNVSAENHRSIVYLLNNAYLLNQDEDYKDAYLEKAFAEYMEKEDEDTYPPTTVGMIKGILKDDDIDVVQQWAIWYFTNSTTVSSTPTEFRKDTFNTFGAVSVRIPGAGESGIPGWSSGSSDDINGTRFQYMQTLYTYLVNSAKNATETETTNRTYPTIDKSKAVTSEVDGQYYKVGPFKVNSGNTTPSDLEITLVAQGGELSNYKIYVNGEETSTPYNEIFNQEYYVYIPIEGNTITNISLHISYTKLGGRSMSLWDKDEGEDEDVQPLVLIIPDPGETVNDEISGRIDEKIYDLALRKYILSINGDATESREPTPTSESLQKLAEGTIETAEYRHSKQPLKIKKGDRIVYEFRIYNEGDLDAKVGKIADFLPEGLTVVDVHDSPDVNGKYNWDTSGDPITSSYLENTTIPAFDRTTKTLSFASIQVECEVTGDLVAGTTLTNVAEIIEDDGSDRDSVEKSIKREDIKDDFSGDPDNKDDLGDKNYHYKGLQDDDDFEKVVMDGDLFDLNLKKFISKVNNENLDRAPKVDPSPLNNGKDDANYETTKTPVNVKTGDIVTFTLRIYNEGDIDGYADQITDYIPEGLGFLVNYKTNFDNLWKISEGSNEVALSTIKDGTKNVKLSDFVDVDSLDDVNVVLGKTKVTTNILKYDEESDRNLIPAFDGNTMTYKDVQISCIVATEDEITLKNIAAITGEKDKDGNTVETDRGSEDRDSTPRDDINPDDYTTGNEDDDDYDVVKTDKKDFDLALQKFITAVNSNTINDRAPTVTKGTDGKLQYNHKTDPVRVHNGDLVTYTIRVYNEGEIDGYAAEVTDNIPTGLVFVPDNETNVKYGWKMYDKSGNETKDVSQAVSVKTTYLSKESSEDNLIPAFNKDADISDTNPSYKDVELVFRLDESMINKTVTTSERTLINVAEISKNTDKDGNDIPDVDSTPGNGNPDEDDIDREQVYVEYFDLALEKDLTKALVTVDGQTTELNVAKGGTIKVDVNKKNLSKTTIKFIYDIVVRNEGEIEGYATEVTDYIPQGLSFDPADNPDWEQVSGHEILTNALAKTLLKPGESARVSVTLTWERNENNMGEFINIAEISEHWNPYGSPDVDSTPDNLVPTEDDYDDAPVYVSIVTGLEGRPYILLTSTVLLILGTGIVLIKKYVLSD